MKQEWQPRPETPRESESKHRCTHSACTRPGCSQGSARHLTPRNIPAASTRADVDQPRGRSPGRLKVKDRPTCRDADATGLCTRQCRRRGAATSALAGSHDFRAVSTTRTARPIRIAMRSEPLERVCLVPSHRRRARRRRPSEAMHMWIPPPPKYISHSPFSILLPLYQISCPVFSPPSLHLPPPLHCTPLLPHTYTRPDRFRVTYASPGLPLLGGA